MAVKEVAHSFGSIVVRSAMEREEMYKCIGEVVSMWAGIDACVYALFHLVLGVDYNRSSLLFYKSTSIKDHLVLTNDLIKSSSVSEKKMSRWREIYRALDKNINMRNELAHNPVVMERAVEDSKGRISFVSSKTDANKIHKSKPFRASVGEIRDYIYEMKAVVDELELFSDPYHWEGIEEDTQS